MKKNPYFMESPIENHRLETQVDPEVFTKKFITPYMKGAWNMLDVGCGPGAIIFNIARQFPQLKVVGVDTSSSRLRAAEEKLEKLENAIVQNEDAAQLPFPDNQFDFVLCRFLLDHLPNRSQALAEMHRVCRPGGRVLLQSIDGGLGWHYPEDPQLQEIKDRLNDCLIRRGYDPLVGRKLKFLAMQKGFTDIHIQVDCYNLLSCPNELENLEDFHLKLEGVTPLLQEAYGDREKAEIAKDYILEYINRKETLTFSNLITLIAKKEKFPGEEKNV